jgi:hypothetical protein
VRRGEIEDLIADGDPAAPDCVFRRSFPEHFPSLIPAA